MPEQGDIVLIPIPFTDLSSNRRRPVIVISNNLYNHKTQRYSISCLSLPNVCHPEVSGFERTSWGKETNALA